MSAHLNSAGKLSLFPKTDIIFALVVLAIGVFGRPAVSMGAAGGTHRFYFNCECLGFMAKIHALSLSMGARICPLCGCKDVLRSHRRGVLEWTILLPLLLRPFRCRQCSARYPGFFFRPRRVKDSEIVAARDID
jgi:hypothetical protein